MLLEDYIKDVERKERPRRHPLAKCEECEWNIEAAGFADATGPQGAELVFIGESPGKHEAKTGIPFTGPTGHLLYMVMDRYDLKRSDIRLTNAVACHPPYEEGMTSTEPPRGVIEACRPRLMAEIEQADTVLLMGNTARRSVTEDYKTGIMKGRQEPPIFQDDGPTLLSTIHPAACLRNPDSFPSFLRDIKKLVRLRSDGPDNVYVNYEPPRYAWYDTVPEAEMVLKKLMDSADLLACDIETGVEKDRDFTHPNVWLSIGFAYAPNKAVVLGERCLRNHKIQRMVGELIAAKRTIWHNGKYDLQVLLRLGVVRPESFSIYADTMLASYVLDERPGNHGLKNLSSEHLGAPDYEHEVQKYLSRGQTSYANVPRKILYKYNAYDCVFTWALWERLSEEMDDTGRELHDYLCELATELIYIELDGVSINEDYLDELTIDYTKQLDQIDEDLSRWVENPRSWQQVAAALKELGLPHETTGADELQRLKERVSVESESYDFLSQILHQRRTQKLYGTYVKGTRERLIDGRVYPTYLLHGTTSGRLSARNPNIHNVPRDSKIKRLFVPRTADHTFIQCDYGQAELRTIAILAQDPYLKEVFEDATRDIHGELADVLFGAGKWDKEDRVRAKSYVFGSIYGLSPYSIALDYGITEMQAFREQSAFFRMIPDTMKWRTRTVKSVLKHGNSLETIFGRRRRFMLITPDNKHKLEKEVLAFLPQSTASDLTTNSLMRIRREFGTGANVPSIKITVHDSIVVECHNDIREDVGRFVAKTMRDTARDLIGDYVPFTTDIEYGDSWGTLQDAA